MARITRLQSGVSPAVRFMFAAAALLGVGNTAHAEEPARPAEDAATRAKATVLIESLVKEREKLVSAVVQVHGGIAFTRDAPPPERTIRGSYAFDYSQGAMRFDSSRRMKIRMLPPGFKDLKAAIAAA